jgi:DNA repair exonuclease SbcCD ATPase subunit
MTVAINDARKELQALAKQMRALMALDEELVAVGGLDALIAQRETQVRDLERQIRDLSVTYSDLEAKNEAMRKSMADDNAKHQAILAEAKREAENVKARARDDALIVVKDANRRADRILQDANDAKKEVQAKVAELQERAKGLQDGIKDMEARRVEIRKEIDRIKSLVG